MDRRGAPCVLVEDAEVSFPVPIGPRDAFFAEAAYDVRIPSLARFEGYGIDAAELAAVDWMGRFADRFPRFAKYFSEYDFANRIVVLPHVAAERFGQAVGVFLGNGPTGVLYRTVVIPAFQPACLVVGEKHRVIEMEGSNDITVVRGEKEGFYLLWHLIKVRSEKQRSLGFSFSDA